MCLIYLWYPLPVQKERKDSLLGQLFSDMVRVVDCHAGVLGSNPGGPKTFSPSNYFSMLSENNLTGSPGEKGSSFTTLDPSGKPML